MVSLEFQAMRAYSTPVFVVALDVQSMVRPTPDFFKAYNLYVALDTINTSSPSSVHLYWFVGHCPPAIDTDI